MGVVRRLQFELGVPGAVGPDVAEDYIVDVDQVACKWLEIKKIDLELSLRGSPLEFILAIPILDRDPAPTGGAANRLQRRDHCFSLSIVAMLAVVATRT